MNRMALENPFGEHGILVKDIDWLVPCCDATEVAFYWRFFLGGKQEVPSDAIKLAHIKG